MKLFCLSFSLAMVLSSASSLQADVHAWSGAAGDGLWATAGNWLDGAVPATNDTALFAANATLTPAADFQGILAVSNAATLQLAVPSDMAFSSAISSNSALVKRGTGMLTLRASVGYYSGGITVQEGMARFAGNGRYEAPGFFGKLTVAGGATAEIVESPADTRHGAVSRGSYRGSAYETLFADAYMSAEKFAEQWNALTNLAEQNQTLFVPKGANAFLAGTSHWPPYYATNALDYFEILSRAVVILPAQASYQWTLYADDNLMLYLNRQIGLNNPVGQRTVFFQQLPSGWNTVDAAFRETTGNAYAYAWIRGNALGRNNLLTQNLLWKGVCFNGLDVQAGGTLNVADGQAVAFSALNGFAVNGAVTGAADAYFAVMAGTCALPSAHLTGFLGAIEVGALAKADLGAIPASASFTLAGEGTVENASGVAQRLSAAEFTGTVDIPSGTVFTNGSAVASNVTFTGNGTLVTKVTDTTVPYSTFAGALLTPAGTVISLVNTSDFAASNLVLSQNATLNIGNNALARDIKTSISDWNTPGCWSLNGATANAGYNQGTAYITNGVLALTDDCGVQRRTANLTNVMVRADDVWQIRFTFSGTLLGKYANELRAEGFSFFLQSAGPASYNASVQSAAPAGAYGFFLYQYRNDGKQGLMWIVNGAERSDAPIKESEMGISLLQPVDFTVSYKSGLLTVVLEQNGKRYTASREISDAFLAASQKYIGFGGGTGYWGPVGSSAQVYLYQTVSAFSGWIHRNACDFGALPASAAYAPFSTGTWQVNDSAFLTNETQFCLISKTTVFGNVVCKTPFSGRRAFRLEFDECLDTYYGGWAEGFSVFFQPGGTDIHYGRGAYLVKKTGGCGLLHYYWENKFGWYNASTDNAHGGTSGTIPKTLGVNHMRILHDGAGTLTMNVTRGDASCTVEQSFPQLPAMGDAAYLGFSGAPAGWEAYIGTRVANLTFAFTDNKNPLFVSPLVLAEGATATLNIGNLSTNATVPSITFTNVVLAAGSTLNIAPTNLSCKAAISRVSLTGAGALQPGVGATLELSTVAFSGAEPCALTVRGAWTAKDNALTFQIPAAWLNKSRFTLADLSGAVYGGESEPVFALVDETGQDLLAENGMGLRYRNGIVYLIKSNGTIIRVF